MNVVIEDLKQQNTAIAANVRRYQGRVDSYRQNRLFQNNQRQFYRELDQEEERCDDDQPVAEKSKHVLKQVNVKKQDKIDITTGSLKKILGRMPNWRSPGPGVLVKEF